MKGVVGRNFVVTCSRTKKWCGLPSLPHGAQMISKAVQKSGKCT